MEGRKIQIRRLQDKLVTLVLEYWGEGLCSASLSQEELHELRSTVTGGSLCGERQLGCGTLLSVSCWWGHKHRYLVGTRIYINLKQI